MFFSHLKLLLGPLHSRFYRWLLIFTLCCCLFFSLGMHTMCREGSQGSPQPPWLNDFYTFLSDLTVLCSIICLRRVCSEMSCVVNFYMKWIAVVFVFPATVTFTGHGLSFREPPLSYSSQAMWFGWIWPHCWSSLANERTASLITETGDCRSAPGQLVLDSAGTIRKEAVSFPWGC